LTEARRRHVGPPRSQKSFIDVLQDPQEADEKILRGLSTQWTLLGLTENISHS